MDSDKINIKPGRYSEKRIVEIFGTGKQKESYHTNGKFVSGTKRAVLSIASKYCIIKDLGHRWYSVKRLDGYLLPQKWKKLNTGFYRYLMPYLINDFIESRKDNIDLYAIRWASKIGLLNKNYFLLEGRNDPSTRRELSSYEGLVTDVYSRINHTINYHFQYIIDCLSKEHVIQTQEIYFVLTRENDGNTSLYNCRAATNEDLLIRDKCRSIADSVGQPNSQTWYSIYYHVLHAHNISFFRKGYKISYIDKEKCEFLLKECACSINDETIQEMTEYFISYLTRNAQKRLAKEPAEYCEGYCEAYQRVCEILISPAAKIYYEYLVKGL